MQHPEKMKNKAVVIKGINDLQSHFGDEVTAFEPKVTRDVLNILCLGYMRRYVKAQREPAFAVIDCTACGTTGVYAPNGGPCFRCKGKGHQDEADQKRNYGYDLNNLPTTAAAVAEDPKPEPTEMEKAKDEVTKRLTGKSELHDEDDIPF